MGDASMDSFRKSVLTGDLGKCKSQFTKKIDIHSCDKAGDSLIISAAENARLDVVEFLILKGANIHDRTNNGWTPLICAAKYGHINIVKFLLVKGANTTDMTNTGSTCYSLATNKKIRCLLRKWKITMLIIVLQDMGIFSHLVESMVDFCLFLDKEDFIMD